MDGETLQQLGEPCNIMQSADLGLKRGGTDYIQTDASLARGSSGGPLVNLAGEVTISAHLITFPSCPAILTPRPCLRGLGMFISVSKHHIPDVHMLNVPTMTSSRSGSYAGIYVLKEKYMCRWWASHA